LPARRCCIRRRISGADCLPMWHRHRPSDRDDPSLNYWRTGLYNEKIRELLG
jgi:hypothetical protein